MSVFEEPEVVQYMFRDAIAGFCELPAEAARTVLPPELQPVELRHGTAVLSVMAFDFHDSPVGAYGELILSVLVSPLLRPGTPLPRSAFYPFQLGTTTRESREHAIERWRLPHYMSDIDMVWERADGQATVEASGDGQPMVRLAVTEHEWSDVEHRYQSFMRDDSATWTATIIMEGAFSENEEERGAVLTHAHGMGSTLHGLDFEPTPFRELWMRDGVQTFHPLELVAEYAGRAG